MSDFAFTYALERMEIDKLSLVRIDDGARWGFARVRYDGISQVIGPVLRPADWDSPKAALHWFGELAIMRSRKQIEGIRYSHLIGGPLAHTVQILPPDFCQPGATLVVPVAQGFLATTREPLSPGNFMSDKTRYRCTGKFDDFRCLIFDHIPDEFHPSTKGM